MTVDVKVLDNVNLFSENKSFRKAQYFLLFKTRRNTRAEAEGATKFLRLKVQSLSLR